MRQHLEKKMNNKCLARLIAHNVTVIEPKRIELNERQRLESACFAKRGFKPHHADRLAVRINGPVLGHLD
jgi:hypothetical protein